MNLIPTFTPLLKRKLATAVLVTAYIAAFATLGDGGKKRSSSVVVYNYSKNFSLRSGFNYKSNNIFALPETKNFIMLNTVITYQKGSATYIMPVRKKVLLDKIRITPTPFRY